MIGLSNVRRYTAILRDLSRYTDLSTCTLDRQRFVDTATGTKERKRAIRAMPPRAEARSPGCVAVVLAYLTFSLYLYWATRAWLWLALAIPAVLVVGSVVVSEVFSFVLLAESRRAFEARGIRCLVVYSESPTWEEYICDRWLPRLGHCAVMLNSSDRSRWPASLEVRLFKHFVGSSWRNVNPSVLVFRGRRRPRVYRFFYAFQQAKHGRTQYLNALEAELFSELGI